MFLLPFFFKKSYFSCNIYAWLEYSKGSLSASALKGLLSLIPVFPGIFHIKTPQKNIPWMEEPVRLQSMGSLRVGHD